jgi:hypothetical protein
MPVDLVEQLVENAGAEAVNALDLSLTAEALLSLRTQELFGY